MTLLEAYWRFAPRTTSRWRRAARAEIERVLESDPADLAAAITAAYLWGERSHAPYKAWLSERAIVLALAEELARAPTEEERAAIAVAGDLVQLGREDEARALLEAQAPMRHARWCPTCLAKPGQSCREPVRAGGKRLLPHAARSEQVDTLAARVRSIEVWR